MGADGGSRSSRSVTRSTRSAIAIAADRVSNGLATQPGAQEPGCVLSAPHDHPCADPRPMVSVEAWERRALERLADDDPDDAACVSDAAAASHWSLPPALVECLVMVCVRVLDPSGKHTAHGLPPSQGQAPGLSQGSRGFENGLDASPGSAAAGAASGVDLLVTLEEEAPVDVAMAAAALVEAAQLLGYLFAGMEPSQVAALGPFCRPLLVTCCHAACASNHDDKSMGGQPVNGMPALGTALLATELLGAIVAVDVAHAGVGLTASQLLVYRAQDSAPALLRELMTCCLARHLHEDLLTAATLKLLHGHRHMLVERAVDMGGQAGGLADWQDYDSVCLFPRLHPALFKAIAWSPWLGAMYLGLIPHLLSHQTFTALFTGIMDLPCFTMCMELRASKRSGDSTRRGLSDSLATPMTPAQEVLDLWDVAYMGAKEVDPKELRRRAALEALCGAMLDDDEDDEDGDGERMARMEHGKQAGLSDAVSDQWRRDPPSWAQREACVLAAASMARMWDAAVMGASDVVLCGLVKALLRRPAALYWDTSFRQQMSDICLDGLRACLQRSPHILFLLKTQILQELAHAGDASLRGDLARVLCWAVGELAPAAVADASTKLSGDASWLLASRAAGETTPMLAFPTEQGQDHYSENVCEEDGWNRAPPPHAWVLVQGYFEGLERLVLDQIGMPRRARAPAHDGSSTKTKEGTASATPASTPTPRDLTDPATPSSARLASGTATPKGANIHGGLASMGRAGASIFSPASGHASSSQGTHGEGPSMVAMGGHAGDSPRLPSTQVAVRRNSDEVHKGEADGSSPFHNRNRDGAKEDRPPVSPSLAGSRTVPAALPASQPSGPAPGPKDDRPPLQRGPSGVVLGGAGSAGAAPGGASSTPAVASTGAAAAAVAALSGGVSSFARTFSKVTAAMSSGAIAAASSAGWGGGGSSSAVHVNSPAGGNVEGGVGAGRGSGSADAPPGAGVEGRGASTSSGMGGQDRAATTEEPRHSMDEAQHDASMGGDEGGDLEGYRRWGAPTAAEATCVWVTALAKIACTDHGPLTARAKACLRQVAGCDQVTAVHARARAREWLELLDRPALVQPLLVGAL
eukprot:jgi/Mesvir1/22690/Mv14109-RA.2